MTTTYVHRKDQRLGIIGTVIFHVLLMLLFLFIGLKQPFPLPEETGIEVAMADYGTSEFGQGDNETRDPAPENAVQSTAASSSEPETTSSEDVLTQEESPAAVTPTTKPKEPKKETPREDPTPKEPTVSNKLNEALNAWNTKPSGGSGEGNDQQTGNAGVNTGKPDGQGTFHGDGWDISLGGRGLVSGPNISDKPDEAGKVVLNIFVDRSGKVIRTTPNLSLSTTTSQTLFSIANKAALQCKFNAKPDAAIEQKGLMTFHFILQ